MKKGNSCPNCDHNVTYEMGEYFGYTLFKCAMCATEYQVKDN